MFELQPKYHNQKSFYGKAKCFNRDGWLYLQSYESEVCRYHPTLGIVEFLDDSNYSPTTRKHVWEFLHLLDDNYSHVMNENLMTVYNLISKIVRSRSFSGFLREVCSINFKNGTYTLENNKLCEYRQSTFASFV